MFQLLDLEHSEEQLHSRFLAEFLNPRGSHGRGDVFLQLFLEQVGRTDWLRSDEAVVEREKDIGQVVIAGEDSTGGRIDIFITGGDRHLAIENKIWSGEGSKQITRYSNFASDRNIVLFLTLRGTPADTKKQNYQSISYSEHILPWLGSCQRECADFPVLRETIKQYLITVKRLTGKLTMDNQQLMALMREQHSAARAIRQNYDQLVLDEVSRFAGEVLDIVRAAKPVEQEWRHRYTPDLDGGNWEAAIEITHPQWGGTKISWIGEPSILTGPILAVIHRQKLGRDERNAWFADLAQELGVRGRKSDNCPFYAIFDDARFQTEEQVARLFSEISRNQLAEQIAAKLLRLVDFCDSRLRPDRVGHPG